MGKISEIAGGMRKLYYWFDVKNGLFEFGKITARYSSSIALNKALRQNAYN